jgi:hypothetical protein
VALRALWRESVGRIASATFRANLAAAAQADVVALTGAIVA